jgi:hypothetical protein
MKKKKKNINYIIFCLIFILIIFIIYKLFNKKIEKFKIDDHQDIIIYTYGNIRNLKLWQKVVIKITLIYICME